MGHREESIESKVEQIRALARILRIDPEPLLGAEPEMKVIERLLTAADERKAAEAERYNATVRLEERAKADCSDG